MTRYYSGLPREITDLDAKPALNYPSGYEDQSETLVLAGHVRALSAFVAQLHARVKELEASRG